MQAELKVVPVEKNHDQLIIDEDVEGLDNSFQQIQGGKNVGEGVYTYHLYIYLTC